MRKQLHEALYEYREVVEKYNFSAKKQIKDIFPEKSKNKDNNKVADILKMQKMVNITMLDPNTNRENDTSNSERTKKIQAY